MSSNKKWGASVGKATLQFGDEVWSMDITDQMKESVLYEGQVMFSDRDNNTYTDYDKLITIQDVEVLRSIGKKSVNKFTSEDTQKSQKWAYKFYQELETKSPFFRAWFGDWREHDKSIAQIVDAIGDARGVVKNEDTNWDIQTSKKVHKETKSHSGSTEKNAVKYLPYIDDITKKAILFDTYVSDKDNENSMLFHSMYAYTEVMGYPALLRLRVEELFYYDAKTSGVVKRDYILQNIEEELISKRNRFSRPNRSNQNSSDFSISDLFALVKEYDKEFNPKSTNKVLLNEDGTPKKFYHGTNEEFTAFSADEIAPWEGSFFFAENREDAEAYGNNVFEVYLTGDNLADYDNQPSEFYRLKNKHEQVEYLKKRDYDGWYADMESEGWGEVSVFSSTQIKSATNNIGTFDSGNPNTQYSDRDNYGYHAGDLGKAESYAQQGYSRGTGHFVL